MSNPLADKLVDFLVRSGIRNERILEVMRELPREMFVSQAMIHQAYNNNALPIGQGQTISQPYIVALMTQLLDLSPESCVLEVGTGSGYQTAVLAHLVEHVFTIERIKSLQWDAKRRLRRLDIYNVSMKHGDGWQGWAAKAPFDAIIVTAAATDVPTALLEQLSDQGCLVIPVGDEVQTLLKITRDGDAFSSEEIELVRFVPLIAGELA